MFLKNILGLVLIFVAWYNPFNLAFYFRITFFIIGFDLTSWLVKLALFVLNFFFPVLGEKGLFLVWVLFFFLLIEFILTRIKPLKVLLTLMKPSIVFFSIFLALKDFQLALIIAGIDLVINLKH